MNGASDGLDTPVLPRHYGRRAIVILIGLVIHFHAVYSLLAILNDYILPVAVSTSVAVLSIAVMTVENTLGNILQFEMDTSGEAGQRSFCCGAFDYHLKRCFGHDCSTKICFNRRIYFVRLFYYNMNAFLIAAAWFGLDVNRAVVTEKIVGGNLAGRACMDIVYLILSNVVLISCHELMGQFGVVGDQAVLQYPGEEAPETMAPDPDYTGSPCVRSASMSSPPAFQEQASPQPGVLRSGTLQQKLIEDAQGNATSPTKRTLWGRFSVQKEAVIARSKVIVAFIALTMYWTATWDLFCSIPSEEMVGVAGDDGDDDYYDVHVKGRSDDEFILLLLGISYAVVALVYMIVTGELFSVVKRQDSHAEKIRMYFKEKISCAVLRKDVEWVFRGVKFFPLRLLSHNAKGSMSVIGWAGLSMILSSIERNVIYTVNYSVERRVVTQLVWLCIANVILILTNDFGLQYGGSEHFASKHEVLVIDLGGIPPVKPIKIPKNADIEHDAQHSSL